MQGDEPLTQLGNRRAVPEIGLHEPLDRPLADRRFDVPFLGDAQLLVADQNVLAAARLEVQVDTDVLEIIVGGQEDAGFVAAEGSLQTQGVDAGRAEAGVADPPQKMQVPEARRATASRPVPVV